jgi:hypothetical protein
MTIDQFQAGIRASVRGLWIGALSREQFIDSMTKIIQKELWNAWIDGITTCGLVIGDLENEDMMIIGNEIIDQLSYIDGFADDIVVNNKFYGGKLQPILDRSDMWINRYNSVMHLAQVTVCGDEKYKWNLGATEEHCESCLSLNGIVKRASIWKNAGISPQNAPNDKLECGGWRCDCSLDRTSEPSTPGPLPSLP